MTTVTVAIPQVGTEAYFSFKEPLNTYVRNKYNLSGTRHKLKVITILNMKDGIRTDLRDPFTDLYDPAGLTEVQFKMDLKDEIPLISFSHTDSSGVERFIRVPLNYIAEIGDTSTVEYLNRMLVVDLGKLPSTLNLESIYQDVVDFVATRTGVTADIKDVTVGEVVLVDSDEHKHRESIRTNSVTVHKTLAIQLAEITESRDQILHRLDDLGISLA